MDRVSSHKVVPSKSATPLPLRMDQNELTFGGDAAFLQEALGSVPNGTIALLAGRPGCGKSTVAIQAAAEVAFQGGKVLYLSTEMAKERVVNRLRQVTTHHSKRVQKQIERIIHVVDDLGDVSYLPDFLLRRISAETHTGVPYRLVIMDSINSGVPSSASKTFKRIFDAFSMLRSASVSFLGLATANKNGKMAGPNSLAHESCANLMLTTAANHRYLSVAKNRNGQALGQPIFLTMTPKGKLLPSPHQGSMACSVQSFLPGDNFETEIFTSISLPQCGEGGRVLCPNLPRLQVSQLIASIERSSRLNVSLESFLINIQLIGDATFRKSLLLPLSVGVLSAFYQRSIPEKYIWAAELDLNLGLRPLPETFRNSLATAIESEALESGTTVVVPSKDADALGKGGRGVRVVGVRDLHDALSLIDPHKKANISTATDRSKRGTRGTPLSRAESKSRTSSSRSQVEGVRFSRK